MTPDLVATAAPLFDLLRGERWIAPRVAPHGPPGAHRSRRRGSSLEFTEYRPYRQGDDPRRLDWKLLARTDRAYVRITDDHAVMPTVFVVDASASMGFPLASLAKWRLAQLVTLGLAFVAIGEGDPVALGVVATQTVRRPLQLRRGVVADLTRALDSVAPSGSGTLTPLLDEFAGRTRGRLVVVSDFLGGDAPLLTRAHALIAAGVTVHAVHVVAREELSPEARAAIVADPEDPAVRRPLTGRSRAAYLARFGEWRAQLRHQWRAAGASYVMAVTDEPVDRIVHEVIYSHANRM
jgi:uncharacterized protein (DUF58 family)